MRVLIYAGLTDIISESFAIGVGIRHRPNIPTTWGPSPLGRRRPGVLYCEGGREPLPLPADRLRLAES